MKKFMYALVLAPVMLAACGESFKKTKGGMQYKIIRGKGGDSLKDGSFFEFSYKQSYKDSITANSADFSNQIAMMDSLRIPAEIYKIFTQCRAGDSVVMKMLTDSAYKDPYTGQTQLPPGIKKGQYLTTGYKIVRIYGTRQEADSMQRILMTQAQEKAKEKEKIQLVKDDKTIADYLAKNKITAQKAPEGTYVQIIDPGTGTKIDTTVAVKVNYTGRTLGSDKPFDSNTDPSFQHMEPLPVQMWMKSGLIKGWFDGLTLLSKGAKAKFYIPSPLGYGTQGNGKEIKPNDILIFDMEIVDVMTKQQAEAEMQQQQKKMMEMQKRYQDSLNRAAKIDSARKK